MRHLILTVSLLLIAGSLAAQQGYSATQISNKCQLGNGEKVSRARKNSRTRCFCPRPQKGMLAPIQSTVAKTMLRGLEDGWDQNNIRKRRF